MVGSLDNRRNAKLLSRTLTQALTSYLNSATGLLALRGREVPNAKEEIAEAVAEELDLDGAVLHELLAVKHGSRRLKAAELRSDYDRFRSLVGRTADIADAM